MAHHTLGRRRGSAAIEFAIWLPVLFILLSAVIDWGYYMSVRVNIARATMDGCRVGAALFEPKNVTPGVLAKARAKQRTEETLAGLGITCASGCTVAAQYCPDGNAGPCGVPPFDALIVQTSYDFDPWFGWAKTPTVITEDFVMATENQRD